MDTPTIQITALRPEDIPSGMLLSSAENWNQTPADWQLFLEGLGNVAIAARFGNRLVGTTTAMNYLDRVAWIGMVLVDREFRGKGISRMLLQETFNRLKGVSSLKLDATPAGHPVYEKMGFHDEYTLLRMIRMEETEKPVITGEPPAVPMTSADLGEIISLDARIFGARREMLIGHLWKSAPGMAWIIRNNGEKISGFIMGRPGSLYTQIGPLYAEDEKVARSLFVSALAGVRQKPVMADIPMEKETFCQWLGSLGFSRRRPFTRMYLGKNPYPGLPAMQFLISGPEFG